jgi:hypothetical protein
MTEFPHSDLEFEKENGTNFALVFKISRFPHDEILQNIQTSTEEVKNFYIEKAKERWQIPGSMNRKCIFSNGPPTNMAEIFYTPQSQTRRVSEQASV